jgi:ligand-binding sensor domain-containing protein
MGVIQCPHEAFTATCDAVLPIAEQGGFANYLFKGEAVTAIAVDGADRKWIGTKNGVWLINAEGDKVLEHFTEDNSKLLSDDIKRIAINGITGEVFFATAKGISSFKGTATEGGEKTENFLVYPNPVPPGYGGMIAIKGLKQNSFVKITELNGRLVYQTKALGGQAVWNGKNYKGEPIASGVYIILVTDEGQVERNAGRIVFIK